MLKETKINWKCQSVRRAVPARTPPDMVFWLGLAVLLVNPSHGNTLFSPDPNILATPKHLEIEPVEVVNKHLMFWAKT